MGAWPERETPAEKFACGLRGGKGKGFKPFPFLFALKVSEQPVTFQ
jgi:hypothetical protein